jgi:hypothetical protein
VRLGRRRLDRELADGRGRDESAARALRAAQLAAPQSRLRLARSLRRAADASTRVDARMGAPLRPRAGRWREALIGLAERLEKPVSVNVRGIARARRLLADGAGPLYGPGRRVSLGDAVWSIADGLALCPPHAWGCPVVMKVDPERVAWTCGRCGEIATTADHASRPA